MLLSTSSALSGSRPKMASLRRPVTGWSCGTAGCKYFTFIPSMSYRSFIFPFLLFLFPFRSLCCAHNSQFPGADPRIYLVFFTLHNVRGSRRRSTPNSGSTLICGKCFVFNRVASMRFGSAVLCWDSPRHSGAEQQHCMEIVNACHEEVGPAESRRQLRWLEVFGDLRNQHSLLLVCLFVAWEVQELSFFCRVCWKMSSY